MKTYEDISWDLVRKQFPVCQRQTHFFTAAVGPLSQKVYDATKTHLDNLLFSGDVNWSESIERMERTRDKVAALIGATSDDIGFGTNTSFHMNVLAMLLKQSGKKQIILPADEFPSSTLPWYHHGYKVTRVASDDGFIDIEKILDQVCQDTACVLTSAIQYSTGFRQDLITLGKELEKANVPLIVNATQALGAFPISVEKASISALTASCHKWMGAGYGISVLFLNENLRKRFDWPLAGWLSVDDPIKMSNEPSQLKSSTAGVELGIPPFATLAGLDAACDQILELGVDNIAQRIMQLTNLLVSGLKELGAQLITYRDSRQDLMHSFNSGIVSIRLDNAEAIADKLAQDKIFVSVRGEGIRIAVHYFNNEDDIERLLTTLKRLI